MMKLPETVWDSLPGHGWLTREEAELLWNAAVRTTGDVLEVGCYLGRSTVLLASLPGDVGSGGRYSRKNRHLRCVDPFADGFSTDFSGDEMFRRWQANMAERGIGVCGDPVTLYRMRVEDWKPVPVGFVYLDGSHSEEGTKSQVWKALACAPESIAVHDFENVVVAAVCKILLGNPDHQVGRLAVWET